MYINRYICASETIVATAEPYSCDRPIKAIVEPIVDEHNYETGFTITEITPRPKVNNKQIFKGPHISIRIRQDGSFSGTFHFLPDEAVPPTALKKEFANALTAIQSHIN